MSDPENVTHQPSIDLALINYPSDAITVKHLRTFYPPEMWDEKLGFFNHPRGSHHFQAMLLFERTLATYASNEP